MNGLKVWRTRLFAGAVACTAVVALTQCDTEATAPQKVAAGNLVAPVQATVIKAVEAQTFSFTNAGAVLSPVLANKSFTLTFTNTSAASPTTTVVVPGTGGGTFVAATTYGSCIFTITSSTIAGITVGQQITVNPCTLNVATGGVKANGQATTVNILLQLGQIPSATNQSTVIIDPTTGIVTINNVNTGTTVTLATATGAGA